MLYEIIESHSIVYNKFINLYNNYFKNYISKNLWLNHNIKLFYTWNKWGPLRVHRMNWKVWFRELTDRRPKNDEERTTNDEERLKIFAKSPTETLRKHYESVSAWIFFTATIFLTNFKWFSDTTRVEHISPSLLPLFIGK